MIFPREPRATRHPLVLLNEPDTWRTLLDTAGRLSRRQAPERMTILQTGDPGNWGKQPLRRSRALAPWAVDPAWSGRITWIEREGDPVREGLRRVEEDGCDLILAAARSHEATRLHRQAPCPVLTVPEEATLHDGPLLVPVDFGEESRIAVRHALLLGQALSAPIDLVHVYSIPADYYSPHPDDRRCARSQRDYARDRMKQFVRRMSLRPGAVRMRVMLGSWVAPRIVSLARRGGYSHIVMSSRPRGLASALFLGSIVEEALRLSPVPVWIARGVAGRRPGRVV